MTNMDNCIGKTIAGIEYERSGFRYEGNPFAIRITFTDESSVDLDVLIDETIDITYNEAKEETI